MEETACRITRILYLYTRLCAGDTVRKEEEANRFGVTEKTIQRDLDEIRAFLAEQQAAGMGSRSIVYVRAKRGYMLREGDDIE